MRHVRILTLALTAVFALGAIMAGGAQAKKLVPEWGGCEWTAHGKYTDSACTEPAHDKKTEGRYEWYTGTEFGLVFNHERGLEHGTNINEYKFFPVIGATSFETTTGKKIECSGSEENRLQVQEPNKVKEVLLYLTGCHEAGGDEKECYSPGYVERGIITDERYWNHEEGLKGELVFLSGKGGSEPTIGLTLTAFEPKSENNTQKRLLTVECEGPLSTVWIGGETKAKNGKDEAISLISPVDEMATDFTQTFSQTGGIQSPDALENGKKRFIEEFLGGNWEQAGFSATLEDVSEAEAPPIEIKARP